MKHSILILLCVTCSLAVSAQRNRKATMAPIYAPGYYVNQRSDTIRGEVQINPEDETSFYDHIYFKTRGVGKPRLINAQRAKAYGFDNREFVQMTLDGKRSFLERLVSGRLRLYEEKQMGKSHGYKTIVSEYYIRDTFNDSDPDLKETKRIPQKFYKKALKPYLEDQPMIWADLDKFEFNPTKLVQSLNEFNQFYAGVAN